MLYAYGLLTVVHPPNEEEESVRSLIRSRLTFKTPEKKVKQQINALLLAMITVGPKANGQTSIGNGFQN